MSDSIGDRLPLERQHWRRPAVPLQTSVSDVWCLSHRGRSYKRTRINVHLPRIQYPWHRYGVLNWQSILCSITSLCSASPTRLSTWHCPHLLLRTVLRRRCCWAPAPVADDRHALLARRSAANPPHAAAAVERWTDRLTDGRTPDRYIYSAPHAVNVCNNGPWTFQGRVWQSDQLNEN